MARVKGKKVLSVYIQEDIYNQLNQLVKQKYTCLKGGKSQEVEDALRHWLRLHTHKNTQILFPQKMNPAPKEFKVFQQVKHYIIKYKHKSDSYLNQPRQVSLRELREAISAIRGSDERTIKKWLKAFERNHFIKWIAGEVYELN